MKSLYTLALLLPLSLTASAQDAYDAINYGEKDLSGSARYVGMGGALGALGADISVMHSNPAGTGLYRSSDFNVGLGVMASGKNTLGHNSTKFGLDHIGVVFAEDFDDETLRQVNFGIAVKKNRNFLSNFSTNVGGLFVDEKPVFSQTSQIAEYANKCEEYRNKYYKDYWEGVLADMGAPDPSEKNGHEGVVGQYDDGTYFSYPATRAHYSRATSGSNTVCDMNVSINVCDQLFLGASLGFSWIDYSRESAYTETSVINSSYLIENYYNTSGYGLDLKLGFILRPNEDSPFRVGLSYKTPTAYRLTNTNGATIYYNVNDYQNPYKAPNYSRNVSDYDYDYTEPWSVNLSAGYTIGRNIAIGFEYEYQNFYNAKYKDVDGNDHDAFVDVNRAVKDMAKARNTWKVGVEYKPISDLSLRLGYNYVTSPYHSSGYKELGWDSPNTETDWVNWKDLQRYCAGLGYRINKKCYIDFVYQYQTLKGDFYAFNDWTDTDYFPATEITTNRSNATITFGVRF